MTVRNLTLVGGSGDIIDSLDKFKYVDSFSNETLLCCSETQNSSAVSSIETWSAILCKTQSILYYKLRTLCLPHSQRRNSTPTTCLHADVSVSMMSS